MEEEKAQAAQEPATKTKEATFPSEVAQEGSASQTSSEAVAQPAYKGDGVLFELKKEDFKFGFNKADLDEEAKRYLDELLELLQNNAHLKLKVIGHTDDIGTRKANKLVSERRAQAVADYLLSKGLAQERISTEGKGDTQSLKPNDTEENRAANRRVKFIFFTK